MFTGIVQSVGKVVSFQPNGAGARLVVDTGLPADALALGDSIAVDGCCQTIAAKNGAVCTFDALHETLYHNREDATDKALIRERETLRDVRRQIEFFRAGNLITADVAESLLKIVMR